MAGILGRPADLCQSFSAPSAVLKLRHESISTGLFCASAVRMMEGDEEGMLSLLVLLKTKKLRH